MKCYFNILTERHNIYLTVTKQTSAGGFLMLVLEESGVEALCT
jgi:hypothetical protein